MSTLLEEGLQRQLQKEPAETACRDNCGKSLQRQLRKEPSETNAEKTLETACRGNFSVNYHRQSKGAGLRNSLHRMSWKGSLLTHLARIVFFFNTHILNFSVEKFTYLSLCFLLSSIWFQNLFKQDWVCESHYHLVSSPNHHLNTMFLQYTFLCQGILKFLGISVALLR